jgi:hypothetical protein
MDTETILAKYTKEALDILEYEYVLNLTPGTQKDRVLRLVERDIRRGNISVEDFCSVLTILPSLIEGFSVIRMRLKVIVEPRSARTSPDSPPFVAEVLIPADFRAQLRDFRAEKASHSTGQPFYTFTLTKDGKLSRKLNGNIEEYAMTENSLRHRIVVELDRGRSRFHDTRDLAELLNADAGQIRRSVTDLRKQIARRFKGIKGSEFIVGKRNSGYRLGDEVRLM